MYRGTTPTLTIEFDIDVSEAQDIWVTVESPGACGGAEVTHKLSEGGVSLMGDGKTVIVQLTQEETLKLGAGLIDDPNANGSLYVQARVKFSDTDVRATEPQLTQMRIRQILDSGVIE